MKVEIVQTFIGFPDGVEAPEKTFICGAVVEVDDAFGQMTVDKGLAKPVDSKPSKEEPANEVE